MSISAAVQAVCNMIQQGLSTLNTYITNQPQLTVTKDKKTLKKATNYAEQLIHLVQDKRVAYESIIDQLLVFIDSDQLSTEAQEKLEAIKKSYTKTKNYRKIQNLIKKFERND